MITKSVNVLHVVPAALSVGDMSFEKGMKITNESALAAYLKCQYQACEEAESSLTVPEIIDTWNKTKAAHTDMDTDDLENQVIDAMKERQSGAGDDDSGVQYLDAMSAANRIAIATTLGAKLGEEGDAQIVRFLAARMTVKKGPVIFCVDVVRKQWTAEEIDAMPLPWSKNPTKNATVEASNMSYDIYKTSLNGETKRGSWYEDEILGLTSAQQLEEDIERVAKLSDQERTKAQVAYKKTQASQLNAATNLLRRAVMLDKVLRYVDTFDKLEYEIRTDENSVPLDTDYPISLWQKGNRDGGIMLTLNNLMKAFDPIEGDPTISRLEAAKAAGGLLDHFKKHVLPKKERGKNKFPAITDADTSFQALFRLASFYTDSGTATTLRKMAEPGQVGETYLSILGDVMTALLPVWNAPGVRDRYELLNQARATEHRQKIAAASAEYQAKQGKVA